MKRSAERITKRILCLMLVLCIGSSAYTAAAVSAGTQEQIDKVKKEKEEAEQQRNKAEQEKGQLSSQKSQMEDYLKNLEQQTNSLNEQISILTSDIEEKEAQIEEKKVQIQDAQKDVDEQYEAMKKRIQFMYENGQDTALGFLSAALTNGIADMLNRAEYAADITQYDRNMLENYRIAKEELELQEAELEDEQEALELLKEETQKKKEQVAAQQKAAGSKLSEYDELLSQMSGELSSMEEIIAEKTKLLNQLIAKAEAEERQSKLAAAQQAASSMGDGSITAGDSQISRYGVSLSDYEQLLLATMIYCEAGNQGWEGQIAVGYVIMNRVRSALYPNSLEAVLRQSKQFEPAGSGRFDLVLKAEQDPDLKNIVTQSCWEAARTVVNGTSNVGDSLFFRTWAPVPSLRANLEAGGVPYWVIGDHIFYYYWTNYTTKTEPDSSGSTDNTEDGNEGEESEDEESPDSEESEDGQEE